MLKLLLRLGTLYCMNKIDNVYYSWQIDSGLPATVNVIFINLIIGYLQLLLTVL